MDNSKAAAKDESDDRGLAAKKTGLTMSNFDLILYFIAQEMLLL
jgi:hypothetical protein